MVACLPKQPRPIQTELHKAAFCTSPLDLPSEMTSFLDNIAQMSSTKCVATNVTYTLSGYGYLKGKW